MRLAHPNPHVSKFSSLLCLALTAASMAVAQDKIVTIDLSGLAIKNGEPITRIATTKIYIPPAILDENGNIINTARYRFITTGTVIGKGTVLGSARAGNSLYIAPGTHINGLLNQLGKPGDGAVISGAATGFPALPLFATAASATSTSGTGSVAFTWQAAIDGDAYIYLTISNITIAPDTDKITFQPGSRFFVSSTDLVRTDFGTDGENDILIAKQDITRYIALTPDVSGNFSGTRVKIDAAIPGGYQVVGAADVNRDGYLDLIVMKPGNQGNTLRVVYLRANGKVKGEGASLGTFNSQFVPFGVADFDDLGTDGQVEVALYDAADKKIAIYDPLTTTVHIIDGFPITDDPDAVPVATGDINSDGQTDFILFNPNTRQVWYMVLADTGGSGGAGVSAGVATEGPILPANSRLVGAAGFNADAQLDLLYVTTVGSQSLFNILLLDGPDDTVGTVKTGPELPAGYQVLAPR